MERFRISGAIGHRPHRAAAQKRSKEFSEDAEEGGQKEMERGEDEDEQEGEGEYEEVEEERLKKEVRNSRRMWIKKRGEVADD